MNETIDNTLIADLEQRIPELMKEAIVPGLSIALIRNAQVIILTNSANGLNICEEIVRISIGGEHPAFRFLDDFQNYLA